MKGHALYHKGNLYVTVFYYAKVQKCKKVQKGTIDVIVPGFQVIPYSSRHQESEEYGWVLCKLP